MIAETAMLSPDAKPLGPGEMVFLPYFGRFGAITGHADDPNYGCVYFIRVIDPRPEIRDVRVLPGALWHVPAINMRPACVLSPRSGRC